MVVAFLVVAKILLAKWQFIYDFFIKKYNHHPDHKQKDVSSDRKWWHIMHKGPGNDGPIMPTVSLVLCYFMV